MKRIEDIVSDPAIMMPLPVFICAVFISSFFIIICFSSDFTPKQLIIIFLIMLGVMLVVSLIVLIGFKKGIKVLDKRISLLDKRIKEKIRGFSFWDYKEILQRRDKR